MKITRLTASSFVLAAYCSSLVACGNSAGSPGAGRPGSSSGAAPDGNGTPITSTPTGPSSPDATEDLGALWSDPKSWGGKLPDQGSDVRIAAGSVVTLDIATCVNSLVVEGTLKFARKDLEFCTQFIMVQRGGKLEIGTEQKPFTDRAVITLLGSDPTRDHHGMGTKFLGAMEGGILELHGAYPATAWTKVGGPIPAGATTFSVDAANGWKPGDQIVIASDTEEPNQAETHTIAEVSGNQVTITAAVGHERTGDARMIEGRLVDTRAEVGVLNRNIVIRGDEASTTTNFGGHIMVMAGCVAHVEGIELQRLGQLDRAARYPFHWHVAGDAAGHYLKGSVVNSSLQRGIVVHSTTGVLVQDNIVYDSNGHNYIVETSQTNDNIFEHNLALKNRIPVHTDALLVSQNDNEVANFWIKSARNTFRGNAAAGSEASGFWYDQTSDGPTVFEQNVAHSAAARGRADFIRESGLLVHQATASETAGETDVALVLKDTTIFRNVTGMWPTHGNQTYENLIIANLRGGGTLLVSEGIGGKVTYKNQLFVGHSESGPAVQTQYGAKVFLDHPTFVGFGARSVMGSNDINADWQADNTIVGSKFVATEPAAAGLPLEFGITESLDDTFAPKGFYVLADQNAPLAGPGAKEVSFAGTGSSYYHSPRRYAFAALQVFSGGQNVLATDATILRSDGYRYSDVRPQYHGIRVIYDASLTYQLDAPPNGNELRFSLDRFGATRQTETAPVVELGVPSSAAPSSVTRVMGAEREDTTVTTPLTAAASLSAFRGGDTSSYFYDGSTLYLKVTENGLVVTR